MNFQSLFKFKKIAGDIISKKFSENKKPTSSLPNNNVAAIKKILVQLRVPAWLILEKISCSQILAQSFDSSALPKNVHVTFRCN
jgi:hypothetical protein